MSNNASQLLVRPGGFANVKGGRWANEMMKIGTSRIAALSGVAAAVVTVAYGLLSVSCEPPGFRGPLIVYAPVTFLTMPALLIQELYPESWGIKYNWAAAIVVNSLFYAAVATIGCFIARLVSNHWDAVRLRKEIHRTE